MDQNRKPHPVLLTLFLIIITGVIFYWLSNRTFIVKIAGEEYIVNLTVYAIPVFLLLIIFLLLTDLVLKGSLLNIIGSFLSWGYPAFGKSLQLLRDWYDPNKAPDLERQYGGSSEHLEGKHPFGKWMVSEITLRYENNAQAMAYWGAAILIFLIGLRGIKIIPKNEPTLILLGLELEFGLLFLLGMVTFFKPEEERRHPEKPAPVAGGTVITDEERERIIEDLKSKVVKDIEDIINQKLIRSRIGS